MWIAPFIPESTLIRGQTCYIKLEWKQVIQYGESRFRYFSSTPYATAARGWTWYWSGANLQVAPPYLLRKQRGGERGGFSDRKIPFPSSMGVLRVLQMGWPHGQIATIFVSIKWSIDEPIPHGDNCIAASFRI